MGVTVRFYGLTIGLEHPLSHGIRLRVFASVFGHVKEIPAQFFISLEIRTNRLIKLFTRNVLLVENCSLDGV